MLGSGAGAPGRSANVTPACCGCQTTADALAWSLDFPIPLECDFVVRLHGLNSALISDAADAPNKLLVSEFQTAKLCDTPGVINVVLCHHPPDWLMDKADLRKVLRRFAPVALFGHEHSVRVLPDDKQVQLFAGAVQPPRDEPGWLPTYHILQLEIVGTAAQPELLIRVHTREFYNYSFRAWRFEDEENVLERRLGVPPYASTSVVPKPPLAHSAMASVKSDSKMTEAGNINLNAATLDAERELLACVIEMVEGIVGDDQRR